MNPQSHLDRNRSLAERKRRLLQEGALFRAEMVRCRDVVKSNMNGGSLTKGLFGRVAGMAYSLVAKHPGLFSASRLQSLAPLLVTGVSLLSKRSLRKSLVVGSILIAAVGAANYLSGRKNKAVDQE